MLRALSALVFLSLAQPVVARVVSSIPPIDFIVKDLLGDVVSTSALIGSSASPHHYALKMSDTQAIAEADVFIWVGPKLEAFLVQAVLTHRSDSVQLLVEESAGPHEHHHDHSHSSDAHIWLSYDGASEIVQRISIALINEYPKYSTLIETRRDVLLSELSEEKALTENTFKGLREAGFGVYHDGYHEYVNEFRLNQLAHVKLVPGQQVSVKALFALKNKLKNARCILADSADIDPAHKLAKKLALPVVPVDLLGGDIDADTRGGNFITYMKGVRSSFKRCLTAGEG